MLGLSLALNCLLSLCTSLVLSLRRTDFSSLFRPSQERIQPSNLSRFVSDQAIKVVLMLSTQLAYTITPRESGVL